MQFVVTTIDPHSDVKVDRATFSNVNDARRNMDQIVDLYLTDDDVRVIGSVNRDRVVKVKDSDGIIATIIIEKVGN